MGDLLFQIPTLIVIALLLSVVAVAITVAWNVTRPYALHTFDAIKRERAAGATEATRRYAVQAAAFLDELACDRLILDNLTPQLTQRLLDLRGMDPRSRREIG
jgi:hypothetical protein